MNKFIICLECDMADEPIDNDHASAGIFSLDHIDIFLTNRTPASPILWARNHTILNQKKRVLT